MHIPSHQVINVLKAYQKMIIRKKGDSEGECVGDSAVFSGKRHAMVEKITQDIATRIIKSGITRTTNPFHASEGDSPRENLFVFNTVTAADGKITRKLALEAAELLIGSLNQTDREDGQPREPAEDKFFTND